MCKKETTYPIREEKLIGHPVDQVPGTYNLNNTNKTKNIIPADNQNKNSLNH